VTAATAAADANADATDVATVARVAVVTGGSAGIGRAICADLLAQGCTVVSLARRRCDIDHPRLHSIEVDLTDRAGTAQAAAELTRRFPVNTVIHNAGVIRAALLDEVKLSDLDALVDLHLGCAVQLVQAALPSMRAQRFGRVVLLSSRAALGLATRTSYSATKAGMLGMARTWALELAPDGITVNVVAPGPIRTDMFHDVIAAGSDKERALAASMPVRRLGEADDVARAVRFFADAQNGFVTGQVLYVCGGTSVGSLAL
jgi:3-oxoacyl-[acyl-carrier protein] reductase